MSAPDVADPFWQQAAPSEREVRLRCVEAVAKSGVYSSAHAKGSTAAVLESAQELAAWILDGKESVKSLL